MNNRHVGSLESQPALESRQITAAFVERVVGFDKTTIHHAQGGDVQRHLVSGQFIEQDAEKPRRNAIHTRPRPLVAQTEDDIALGGLNLLQQERNLIRRLLHIHVEHTDESATGVAVAAGKCDVLAKVAAEVDYPDIRKLGRKTVEHGRGVVAAAVVNEEKLDVRRYVGNSKVRLKHR